MQRPENAMRNSGSSGNTAKGEEVHEGMVVTVEEDRYDEGAVFNAGAPGSGAIVQVLPNQGQVDADVASFIVANTGGSSSPYGWLDGQLGKAQPVASNPNAGLNSFTPNQKGQVTAEAAAGLLPAHSEMRTTDQVQRDLDNRICSIAIGSAVNTLVPGTLVLKPVVDSLGRITGWVATQTFDQSLAGGSSALVCSN